LELFFNFVSLYGIVFLQEGVRIIPLISSKQLNQSFITRFNTSNNYIPLRFNQAGVMPIILTTAILVVPNYISNLGVLPKIEFPVFLNLLNFLLDWLFWINFSI
jgi:preprotein translocase subunit SecY